MQAPQTLAHRNLQLDFQRAPAMRTNATGSILCMRPHFTRSRLSYPPLVGMGQENTSNCLSILSRKHINGLLEYVHGNKDDPYQICFHQYGRNGVMGPLEPSEIMPVEVGIICEVMASTQERATSICSTARIACVHGPYPGQVVTAGNLAMPFSPLVVPLRLVTEFCVYYLMTLEDGAKQELALCPIDVLQIEPTMPAEKIFVRSSEKVADPWNLLAAKLLNSTEAESRSDSS
ncbi:hypothetical protein V1524DRAFT_32050 [Lipomyces starkeyi]